LIQDVFHSKGINKYVSQYNIDGSSCSPMAAGEVTGLAVKHAKGVEFVE
jgi:hypothetical protein